MRENTILELAERIMDARDSGLDPSELLAAFQREVPYPNVRELFISDQGAEYIVRRALAYGRVPPGPGQRAALIVLVGQIRLFEGGECEVEIAQDRLGASVSHPDIGSLLADVTLSEEAVVDAVTCPRNFGPRKT